MAHDIHIPPAALEAGARAIGEETYVGNKETLRDAARACCLAMLKAWPGMATYSAGMNGPYPYIILPLPPQEASDAKR